MVLFFNLGNNAGGKGKGIISLSYDTVVRVFAGSFRKSPVSG